MSADAEGRELRDGAGARIVLAALIKSGGAGSVYRVQGQPLLVAKLYHPSVESSGYERKVAAMLALTPDLPELVEGGTRYVQIAWPKALLRDLRGRFVGYLMPAVDVAATSELECVMQEKQARALGLPTGLGAKVTLAANLANVIAELHRQQHRVVDLKPVNLRFYPRSLYMAMLDCDGFSIQGRGERFDAPQVTVDYLAPEFQRGGLTAAGEEAQDRFALAVIVFQLLNFGIHPFTGRPANDRVPTDVPSRIAARLYAYGLKPNAQLSPNPVSGHAAMPAELRQLFDRAFEGSGAARPSPLEWGAALRPYAQRASLKLVACARDGAHQHFAGLPCAACARRALIDKSAQRAPAAPVAMAAVTAAWVRGLGTRTPAPTAGPPPRTGFGRRPVTTAPATRGAAPLPPPTFPPPLRMPAYPASSAPGVATSLLKIMFLTAMLLALSYFLSSLRHAVPRHAPRPAPSYAALAPPAPAPPAAPAPATAQAQAYLGPIASEYASFAGPPSDRDLHSTSEAVDALIAAAAGDERAALEGAMQNLQRQVRTLPLPDAATRREATSRFYAFAAQAPFGADAIDAGLRGSYAQLQENPQDAEAACEWSWLSLAAGRDSLARNGFLRAIWADPQYACGWLGLGTLAEDPSSVFGATLMAETLRFPDEDLGSRDRLVELRHAPDSDGLRRWQIIDARARLRVAELRGDTLPAPVSSRARELLPRRR